MKIYKLKETHKYNSKVKLKSRTATVFGCQLRILLVDDTWYYNLQDILSVVAPPSNSGHHVAEWLRRSTFIDADIFMLDSQSHYATWGDCCELAEAYMYVYRKSLSLHGRVRYLETGEYERFSVPCKTRCAEASPYKLWRALLDKAQANNSLSKFFAIPLTREIDFNLANTFEKTQKPMFVKKPKEEVKASINPVYLPVIDKNTVRTVTEEKFREDKAPGTHEPTQEPSVSIKPAESVLTELIKSSNALVAALLSGKKFKIEISLGD
jgi:hypothetical protein